jgi:2-oxoglutarate ferredoxin oxidoreductase subunit alpha
MAASIIANSGAFTDNNLAKAGYAANPLTDGSLGDYRVYQIDISGLTAHALKDSGLSKKDVGRCKNYYALGLMLSLYSRPLEKEEEDVRRSSPRSRRLAEANVLALRAGYAYADATEMFITSYRVRAADIRSGNLPQPDRQPRDRARLRRRLGAVRGAAVPRLLPDHAGHRHPARACRR